MEPRSDWPPGGAGAGGRGPAPDPDLLPPLGPAFSPPLLFVCTFYSTLVGSKIGVPELTELLLLRGQEFPALAVVNSNYGNCCFRPGYEAYVSRRKPDREKPRKVQGNGSSFNSAVELVLALELPDSPPGKVYRAKLFPSRLSIQIPGVIRADLTDGNLAIEEVARILSALGVPVRPGPPGEARLINHKFCLQRRSPRVLVNLGALGALVLGLERAGLHAGAPAPAEALAAVAAEAGLPPAELAAALPPYPLRETKCATNDVKLSFKFQVGGRNPRVNVFQRGKVNILGAAAFSTAPEIHAFFVRLFGAFWRQLVAVVPLSDAELLRPGLPGAPARPPPSPRPPSPATLAELEALGSALLAAGLYAPEKRESPPGEGAGPEEGASPGGADLGEEAEGGWGWGWGSEEGGGLSAERLRRLLRAAAEGGGFDWAS
jgi:hypothetical protein